jgi:hypothetical protein
VRILGLLAVPGTISAVAWPLERLVRDFWAYRLESKKIALQREQFGLGSGCKPAKAVRGRHARRRSSR